ncbi:Oleate hydratase [Granulicella sibirica]|uniref:Oleate hydratase n=2 Tax=Granulicella sibirica TaxID=2479048 RepID=A0A4Q0SZN3_9BACT|nr:Oleate hydratase [Granulicella sibirica]
MKVYLIGGGIASLAAAAFLIRDAGFKGHDIIILEESKMIGGSLDANGSPESGYVMRGGRMIESKYLCTFDLFSSIPTLDNSQSVTDEIFAWNKTMKTASRCRLFRDGKSVDAPLFGLSESHILTIERLEAEPESLLGRTAISDQFAPDFFKADFWYMWCTTFAFQPWHSAVEFKRYLVRFTHMISGFSTLGGIMRTVYNQYDSLVRPLRHWLEERGVQVLLNTQVLELTTLHAADGFAVEQIMCERSNSPHAIRVTSSDLVFATLGSMTEGSHFGAMDRPAILDANSDGSAWSLWKKLAAREPDWGNPENFSSHIEASKWLSFTTTLHTSTFFDSIRDLTGNAPGEGGLITFPESNWLVSIVLPHQPHFMDQPQGVDVFWGYSLFIDQPGNFVKKPMAECTGREIMTEIMGHLRLSEKTTDVLSKCICIPCIMPFITSQFLPRSQGDRPAIIPSRSKESRLHRPILRNGR